MIVAYIALARHRASVLARMVSLWSFYHLWCMLQVSTADGWRSESKSVPRLVCWCGCRVFWAKCWHHVPENRLRNTKQPRASVSFRAFRFLLPLETSTVWVQLVRLSLAAYHHSFTRSFTNTTYCAQRRLHHIHARQIHTQKEHGFRRF